MLSQTKENKLKSGLFEYFTKKNLDPTILTSEGIDTIIQYVYSKGYNDGYSSGETTQRLFPRGENS